MSLERFHPEYGHDPRDIIGEKQKAKLEELLTKVNNKPTPVLEGVSELTEGPQESIEVLPAANLR